VAFFFGINPALFTSKMNDGFLTLHAEKIRPGEMFWWVKQATFLSTGDTPYQAPRKTRKNG
jgi:hypothetical protein